MSKMIDKKILIAQLRELSRKLEGGIPTIRQISEDPDTPSYKTFRRRFGVYQNTLEAAGLMPEPTKQRRFDGNIIRYQIIKGEIWFCVNDVLLAISETSDARNKLRNLLKREPAFERAFHGKPALKGEKSVTPPIQIYFSTSGGRQLMFAWNREGIMYMFSFLRNKKKDAFLNWADGLRQD